MSAYRRVYVTGLVAPSRERELKSPLGARLRIHARVAPSRERELKFL